MPEYLPMTHQTATTVRPDPERQFFCCITCHCWACNNLSTFTVAVWSSSLSLRTSPTKPHHKPSHWCPFCPTHSTLPHTHARAFEIVVFDPTIDVSAASSRSPYFHGLRVMLLSERECVHPTFLLAFWSLVLLTLSSTFNLLSWSHVWECAAFVGTVFDCR